jgi:predicted metal-dependent peptidase
MSTHLNDTTALARVQKARVELIMTRTFYGVLVGQVQPVISRKVKTAATDGRLHYWNPAFVETIDQDELLGVQAHESEHDARRHGTRRMGRDPKEWNICCDFAINGDLIAQGFKLPKRALIDTKYKGMSAEDIYRSREIDRALEQQKQQEQAKQDQQDAEDAEAAEEAGNDAQDSGDADEAGSNGTDSDREPAGEATGEGEADEAGDTPADAGTGSSDAHAPAGEASNSAASGASGAADGEPEPVGSTGDPGGCGEVLDAADTTAELAGEDAKWETVLRQAAMLAAKRGTAPGHVARELEHADHPPQDWRETLRAFYDGGATTQETWSRPNRRLIGSGLYLPGRQRDGVNKVYFLIDTSGSVTYYPGALEAIKTETQAALDEGIIDSAVVVYGDAVVTRTDEYVNGDEIEFDPRGGGGTRMKPLFDFAREAGDASLVVCFTDMEIEPEDQLGPEPECPVLWAAVGYPDRVKQYLKNTPWNAAGIEVVPSYN